MDLIQRAAEPEDLLVHLALTLARQAAREDHVAKLECQGEVSCASPSTPATPPTSKILDR